jgi:F-type H+-transporting ATPase subunit gamma
MPWKITGRRKCANPFPEARIVAGIGEQVITRVESAGITPDQAFNMPTSIEAITPFIQRLLERIERWRSEDGVERVILFYNRPLTGGFTPRAESMLPVDLAQLRERRLKWESRSLPTFTMEAGKLLSYLLRQYFFVSLYRACALSLAAENTSRLAAMQAAEKNINERLDELKTSYQQERQTAITEELLDIISGFRAVRKKTSNL